MIQTYIRRTVTYVFLATYCYIKFLKYITISNYNIASTTLSPGLLYSPHFQ